MGDHFKSWDTILTTIEFVYNSSVNRTIGMIPFKIITGYKPRDPIDLIPTSAAHRPFESMSTFASHIHLLHKEI